MRKKRCLNTNQILPPYLVPYKNAKSQEDFDIEYIRWEYSQQATEAQRRAQEARRRAEKAEIAATERWVDEMRVKAEEERLRTERKDIRLPMVKNTGLPPDSEIIEESAVYTSGGDWFSDW